MSLFDYRYFAYKNGDLVIVQNVNHDNIHTITKNDRKKARNFQLNYQKYRIISSAAIELIKTAKNAVIFLTFEFNSKLNINERDANRIWNKFIKNFKKTYGCEDYVGVLELTENNTPHYHFLASYPYADITEIDESWKNAILNFYDDNGVVIGDFLVGSVQLPKDFPSVVDDPIRCVRYICKYFSKSRGKYKSKCYFISRNIRERIKPRQLTAEEYDLLNNSAQPIKSRKFDYCKINCYEFEVLAQVLECI